MQFPGHEPRDHHDARGEERAEEEAEHRDAGEGDGGGGVEREERLGRQREEEIERDGEALACAVGEEAQDDSAAGHAGPEGGGEEAGEEGGGVAQAEEEGGDPERDYALGSDIGNEVEEADPEDAILPDCFRFRT